MPVFVVFFLADGATFFLSDGAIVEGETDGAIVEGAIEGKTDVSVVARV
jgi:hypothetical protein